MANVKINQKMCSSVFKRMMEQRKSGGLHVIRDVTTPTKEDVIGRVTDAFNLGKKIDVFLELYGIQKEPGGKKPVAGVFRFAELGNVFYLVRAEEE